MSGLKVWPVVLALLFASPPAKGEEPPFVMFHNPMFEKIPGGRGIEFFYGEWVMLSGTNHTPYLKIGPGKMTWEETGEAPKPWNWPDEPYRVVAEGPNYVLLLVQMTSPGQDGEEKSTHFAVLTFSPLSIDHLRMLEHNPGLRYQDIMDFNLRIYPFSRYEGISSDHPSMTYRSCGSHGPHSDGKMMSWPREKIINYFNSTTCKMSKDKIKQGDMIYPFFNSWSSTDYFFSKKHPPMNLDIQQLMDGYGPPEKPDG